VSWLFWNTLTAGALALLVALFCRLCKPRPAIAHVLWLAVLLRLCFPPLFRVELPQSEPAAPRVVELLSVLNAGPAPAADTDWTAILSYVWLAGSIVLAAILTTGSLRMCRRLRSSDTPSESVHAEIAELARLLGVAVPRTLVCNACSSPFLWTIGRITLVLPRALATTPAGRRPLLAHELAHIRRGDPWIARLEALLAVALWWHPLFWLVRRAMREQAELACDAWALWAAPQARIGYADALIRSLERESTDPAVPVLAARPSARAAFERRLQMILNETVPCRISGWTLAPLCAMTLGLFAMPTFAQGARKEAPPEIRVNGKPVSELNAKERKALLEALHRSELHERVVEGERIAEEPVAPVEKPRAKLKHAHEPDHVIVERVVPGEEIRVVPGRKIRVARGEPAEAREELHESLAKIVHGSLLHPVEGSELSEGIHEVLGHAMHSALAEARHEIRADPDLKRLGIDLHVEKLVESLLDPKSKADFAQSLQAIVRKAIAGALQEGENTPEPEQPAKVRSKRKANKPVEVIPVEEEEIPAAKPRRRVEIR